MALRLSRRSIAVTAVAAGVGVGIFPVMVASADPSAHDWYRLRQCESSNNYRTNTGNAHYGAYQFDVGTWRGVGGHGLPSNASKGEQDARALILYRMRGWQPWQCARIVGLHNDKDARSRRISDIKVPTSGNTSRPKPSSGVPAYPSSHSYSQGASNPVAARWQKQMAHRGAPLHGTGSFGPTTTAVIRELQTQNGRKATGVLSATTWRLAWKGTFHYRTTSPRPVAPRPVAPPHKPAVKAPAWPGQSFTMGSKSAHLAAWQRELHARGIKMMHGTGVYGPHTLAVAKRLQLRNGLGGSGVIGPKTWALAWTGRL